MKEQQVLIVGEQNDIFSMVQNSIQEFFDVSFIDTQHIRSEIRNSKANLVIITKNDFESVVDTIELLLREKPDLSVIYIHDTQDFNLLRDVIRAGAIEFFVAPEELQLLTDKLELLITQAQAHSELAASSGTFKRGRGRIFTFYSGKGGSGRTFLSTTFAQTLKLESTAQVLYIDLNLQFGGAETYLGIESNRSIIDLKPVIDEINEYHVRNVSEQEVHSKLEVLLSPKDAELAENINGDFIMRLLRACRRSYDFIIVDIPSVMDEVGYAVLEETDRIYYVMTLDTPSIKVLKHVEELFIRLGISTEDKFEIIINDAGRENELSKKDLERFVKHPVVAEIRRDLKGVLSAINQGNPIRKEPKEKKIIPAAKDINKWVSSMLK